LGIKNNGIELNNRNFQIQHHRNNIFKWKKTAIDLSLVDEEDKKKG
jgi:hypothetical protein